MHSVPRPVSFSPVRFSFSWQQCYIFKPKIMLSLNVVKPLYNYSAKSCSPLPNNAKYMDVDDAPLNIDDIPNEILDYILSFLRTEDNTWFSVFLTNKRFLDIGKKKFDPSIRGNRALLWACKNGNLIVVKELLKDPRVNPALGSNEAMQLACAHGHLDIVQELLKDSRVDPSDSNNAAVRYACAFGYLLVLKELMKDKRVDPSAKNNWCIRCASFRGDVNIVRELMSDSRVDPSANNNEAFRDSMRNGHWSIVHELMKDSRVSSTALYTGL